MKIRLADYVADFLVKNGIDTCFTVTGGGAMHLNDAFGHKEGLHCMYNHHEQASAIAAESYARTALKPALLCVTTGPGGTNAITGVVGAYLDSIPMFVVSGQVRYDTTARCTGLNIRAMGDQEFDITKAVDSCTKYAVMIENPSDIRYHLEKALYLACNGRPGPVWIDIPVNYQGMTIETEELRGYDASELYDGLPPKVTDETARVIIKKLINAKRPVINAGNGIRIGDAYEVFERVVRKLNVPVVTGWNSIDLCADDDRLYVGRAGIMGDRAGNFAVQNSDVLFSVGSRLSIRQVGYNHVSWARAAYTIVNDIDSEELKKPTLHVDMPVWADCKELLLAIERNIDYGFAGDDWIKQCNTWKETYPVVMKKHYDDMDKTNVYAFIKELSKRLPEGQINVVGNGSACVVGSHGYVIKKNQRFIINSAIASMGYDLPAAVGLSVANPGKDIVLVTGDGSIQMNIQELQTIIHHKMPIKIFVINNNGYHSIRQTQSNFFGEPLVGVGYDSNDLSFPSMEKLSYAYGYEYYAINSNDELKSLDDILQKVAPFICEVFVNTTQRFEPKSATKKLPDGSLVSAPLEDLAPFLPEEEVKRNMYI